MIKENKFSKYLLYAIGEIVLVVIGILIALQINNKNENWKDQKKEKIILETILADLKINKTLIQEGSLEYLEHKDVVQKMANLIGKEASPENIKLLDEVLFSSADYVAIELINSSILSIATTNKLDLIQNESLKQQITRYPTYVNLYKEREELVRSIVIHQIRRTLEKYISMQM